MTPTLEKIFMDKKHNNLAQPETDLLLDKSAAKPSSEAIDPQHHAGVKMEGNSETRKSK